jgi:hypothetical protein
MTNLKQARDSGKLDQFIKEHKGEQGDPAAFNRALAAMAQTSPEAPPASPLPDPAD